MSFARRHHIIGQIAQVSPLIVSVGVSLLIAGRSWSIAYKMVVSCGLALVSVYLFKADRRLFVPVFFFVIHSFMSPFVFGVLEQLRWEFPQIYFLPSIVMYVGILFVFPSLRSHVGWLRLGRLTARTVVLMGALVVGSGVALVGWALWGGIDFADYRKYIPEVGLPILIGYGIVFAIMNSFFEEFLARAVLYDGFSAVFRNSALVILFQAIVFSLWHFNGFPGGFLGVGMVFVWSLVLGALRYYSGGMLAPFIAHIFADATIALIILNRVVLFQ
jgi:membrane protease YdiL (CAAX protease family)